MGSRKYRSIRFLALPMGGILLAGCAHSDPSPPAASASLASATASASAPADPPAHAAAPQSPPLTERQRELADKAKSRFGFLKVAWAQFEFNISDAYDKAFGTSPAQYAAMLQAPGADARWQGINGLVQYDFGEQPRYTRVYAALGKSDRDYLVRATAIRALNRSRDRSPAAVALYVKSLEDPNIPVRLEACKALGHVSSDDAIQPLLRILNRLDEDADVRIAAADALRRYKNIEVARTLVLMLSDRDFGVAWTAHRSLKMMTGKDLQYDEGAWLSYLTGSEKPLG